MYQSRTGSSSRIAALLISTLLLVTSWRVVAIDDLALQIESVAGEGWRAEAVTVEVQLAAERPSATIAVGRLHVAALGRTLSDIRLTCPAATVEATLLACDEARVQARVPELGPQSLRGTLRYGRVDGSLALDLRGLRVGEGSGSMQAHFAKDRWRASATLQRGSVEQLLALGRTLKAIPASVNVSAAGLLDLTLVASGVAADVQQATVSARISELSAYNSEGTLATDKLTGEVSGSAQRAGSAWRIAAEVHLAGGQAYAEPVFLDFGAHALAAKASAVVDAAGTWSVKDLELAHEGVLQARGNLLFDRGAPQPIRELDIELAKLEFPGAYTSYLQPFLLDTAFKSLTSAGSMSGRVSVRNGEPQALHLQLRDLAFSDEAASFELQALQGEFHWDARRELVSEPAALPDSRLSWRGGTVLGMQVGAANMRLRIAGRELRLMEPVSIPLLDGAIDLESLRVRNAGLPTVAFLVDATMRPISTARLCRAFGWPEFGGSIGGVISKLRMREGVVSLGAQLQAHVFDGAVTLRDLRLEQPFGPWPRLHASIGMERLDLELLTSAFSFGRITGRVSGTIEGLELFNWTPVAFDARLYTPSDDRSRHRISQRAVENIGSLGGGSGVTAALSSGFLRFFDDFNYERLGIRCRLANEVCAMSGVGPAPNGGYYLVKGTGLPRIDVIGSAERVDWPRLVQQLIAITESEGPVVQ